MEGSAFENTPLTRSGFVGWSLFALIVAAIAPDMMGMVEGSTGFNLFLLVIAVVFLSIHARRLMDLHISRWWALVFFVPILNIVFWFFLALMPSKVRKVQIVNVDA